MEPPAVKVNQAALLGFTWILLGGKSHYMPHMHIIKLLFQTKISVTWLINLKPQLVVMIFFSFSENTQTNTNWLIVPSFYFYINPCGSTVHVFKRGAPKQNAMGSGG